MKLSGETTNGSVIMPYSWPGGSTLQWGAGKISYSSQHLLLLTSDSVVVVL